MDSSVLCPPPIGRWGLAGLVCADILTMAVGPSCPRLRVEIFWVHYVTATVRTTAGINKAEDGGRMDTEIGFADALQRVFPTAVVRVS